MAELGETLVRERVNLLWLTSGLFHQMVDEHLEALSGVRHLLAGGDVLSPPHVRRVLETLHDICLINGYGPTENTTFTTCYPMTRPAPPPAAVPVGRPIANTGVALLDRRSKPVPVGALGELMAGGDGLARGYFARPGLSAERFVPDRQARQPGERLYRTGDLARYRADGVIEFFGRFDHQVKLRGFRIELGEIEAAFGRWPGVREAVVLVREDRPGDRRLVAYLVGDVPPAEELRRALAEELPEYMVPSAFVPLETLPLNANGKLDRKALPAPEWGGEDEIRLPRTPTEELLAGIWQDVLGIERISSDSDFFELGGHSLLATRVVSRITADLAVEVPLRFLFEAPTIAALATRLDETLEGPALPAIQRVGRDGATPDDLPLSFAQERLWLIQRLEPSSAAYNVPAVLRLTGELDPRSVTASLVEVVRRHEVLRTTFDETRGRPIQVIRAPEQAAEVVASALIDLTALTGERRDALSRKLAAREVVHPFDLTRGPLLRLLLVKLTPTEHLAVLTMHHISTDGWSMEILIGELSAAYASRPLDELPIQYADYAAWQRGWLTGELLARELAWWCEELASVPRVLELPTDRPRPAMQSFDGAARPIHLSSELAEGLRSLSREQGTTLFMTLLAGFETMLARWSGARELLVGSPIANRRQSQVEGLIGFFVNTLALRGDLTGDPTFAQLLARVRRGALAAYAHQDLPFERLVEELVGERDLNRPSLVQAVFTLQNAASQRLELADLEMEVVELDGRRTSKFDLTVVLSETGDGFLGSAEYPTALFDATTVERWMGHWQTLLESAVADPYRPLSTLPWARPAQRHQLLVEWRDNSSDYERDDDLFGLFERQVEASPDAVAAVYGDEHLSYRQLAHRARRLAVDLRRRAVGLDVGVGVALEPSIERLVALLGTVAAGGAYVPLDPSYPEERRAFMIEDLRMPLVLGEGDLATLPQNDGRPLPSASPSSLAYVVYTSGSTGRPKGVAVSHRAVARLVRETNFAPFGPESIVLQLAPVAFDASTLELWGPLLNGGQMIIYPQQIPALAELGETLVRERVNLLWLTSGLFHQMVDEHLEALSGVRHLLAGGDVLSPPHVRRVLETLPDTCLINGYGPTENTTFTACHPMTAAAPPRSAVPVGRPISNTGVALLDRLGEPVPVGALGELMAGGDGLARGYFARPGLSAERFVPDRQARRPGERLYRTGDLARYRADGVIDFFGRFDHQVKLRGYRIELGEIEAAFGRWPAVREAVVLMREDLPGDRRLVAYLVGDVPPVTELRRELAEELPEYMVPAAFVTLEALPLNANGKLDRKALPAPEWSGGDEIRRPRTTTEKLLAEIWQDALGIEAVSTDADFFELGGHSLLVTRVVSRITTDLGVDLSLRTLFEAPTIATLAVRVDAALQSTRGRSLPPLVPIARDDHPPLSFAQERLWFLDRLEPSSATYNIPMPLRLTGPLDVPALAGAIDAVARRHQALRTTFPEIDGQPVQRLADHPGIRLPLIDLSALTPSARGSTIRRRIIEDSSRPFDLAGGPLMRCQLLRLDAGDHTVHHIVFDGWSMGVLMRELAELYDCARERRPSCLEELPIQYADFAAWQRGWLAGEVLERELDWWRNQLEGAATALELPIDRPRPPRESMAGRTEPIELPADLTDRLDRLARRQGATLFMTLLAAYEALLSRFTGQRDFLLAAPIANRHHVEIEGLIGFFVNTLVHRARLTDDPTFDDLVQRTRESNLKSHSHQDLPFEKLIEGLDPRRDLSRAPLVQTIFQVQNAAAERPRLSGLELEPLASEIRTTHFELELGMSRTAEGFVGEVGYRTDLFDRSSVQRLARRWRRLLESLVEDPGQRVSEIDLLGLPERHQLLHEWQSADSQALHTERGHRSSTLLTPFRARVARAPDVVAAFSAGHSISYGELDRRARRLAGRLLDLGLEPEERIGICMKRSPELLSAVLGTLMAGGVYVPLDPDLPDERLRFLITDSGARRVLCRGQSQRLADLAPLLDLKSSETPIASSQNEAIPPELTGGRLAYVIYTSGSTGRPKGVGVPHGAATRHFQAMATATAMTGEDRVLHFASPSFDASLEEIFPALFAGACVVIRGGDVWSREAFWQRMARWRVTLMDLPTAYWHQVAPTDKEPGLVPESMRWIMAGGEGLRGASSARWRSRHPPESKLVNTYGPTEAVVTATWLPIVRGVRPGLVCEPIGRPLPDRRSLVLDARGRPQPAGVAGELALGGLLARGYLGRPATTAERFVPDGLANRAGADQTGARLYRTGDLVRASADGGLDFLGRIDHQVKVRGFRIELGEIEEALGRQPEVDDAAVAAVDERLVAYVVLSGGEPLAKTLQAELRRRLGKSLPQYMVPSTFVPLDALPLNSSGKVDRRALPAPDWSGQDQAMVLPTTVTEELLVGIWCDVLGLDRVSTDADFFASGGHSLLATRVVSRVAADLGKEIPLRVLFEAPTIRALARRLDATARGLSLTAIERVSRDDALRLSFAQERLWFLDRLEPGQTAYNVPMPLRLIGELDSAALHATLSEIVRRHEILRTTFTEIDGQPVQVVADAAPVMPPLIDLSGLEGSRREATAQRITLADSNRPFDLRTGPLMRCLLVRLDSREHIVLFTLHHIVFDGWSTDVLVRELATLYRRARERQPSPLRELPVQYADFAVWQRGWLAGETLANEITWWRDQLDGTATTLELPIDRPRPKVQSQAGLSVPFEVPPALVSQLDELARAQGATLFMTLLAAYQALLSRFTGQSDFPVATPIANRHHGEVEGLIGFFVNTLVLRADLTGDPTFLEILGRTRETSLAGYAHQDLPFEKLIEALEPERDLSRPPLVQTMFQLVGAATERLELPDLELEPLGTATQTTKFELRLALTRTADGLTGDVGYRTDLFDSSSMRRLVRHWLGLLESVARNPQHRVSRLALLTSPERQQLLHEWQDSAGPAYDDLDLISLIEERAPTVADSTALVFEDSFLSFGELERRANRLAHELLARGLEPETRVGVTLERSLDLVIALLAVLKAGGAYVPLDPRLPAGRLEQMIGDAGPLWIMTRSELQSSLPEGARGVLCLDTESRTIASRPSFAPKSRVGPRHLAYVIFTSGSTGRPKGVMIPRGAVTHRLLWKQEAFSLGRADRLLQKTPYSFDVSVWELFSPLIAGACLVVARPEAHRDRDYLVRVLERQRITLMHFTVSMLPLFLESPRAQAACQTLRRVLVGGEAVTPDLVAAYTRRLSPPGGEAVPLDNLYGPTETTINVSRFSCKSRAAGNSVPIGRPIDNTRLWIVDRRLRGVAAGVAGELLIGGVQVGRGYIGNPALTAERFVPAPAGSRGRAYRSGDLTRFRADGAIEFLGRIDRQIKLRGFRIELGEIERVLAAHPAVLSAVAELDETRPDDRRLLAWVLSEPGLEVSEADLLAFAHTRLPDYSVPSAVASIRAFPTLPSGKVDRGALPRIEARRGDAEIVAPSTETELALSRIWSETLDIEVLSARDDFFDLGGHSLLATRVISRIATDLGKDIPLRALFEEPTITALAKHVDAAGGELAAPTIEPAPRDGVLPLSFAQQRLWVVYQLEPTSAAYNVPAALRLRGELDVPRLHAALIAVVQRHEVLRTTFDQIDGKPAQVIHPASEIPEMIETSLADLTALPLEDREPLSRGLVARESGRPFDLVHGPTLRLLLVKLAANDHVAVLTLHHIATDAWSVAILIEEFSALYSAHSLPDLPVQYADFAAWQRRWLAGERLDQELAWWRQELASAPRVLELPTDRPRPAMQSFEGSARLLRLSGELTGALRRLSRERGTTLFMTLLAGFEAVLARWSGAEELLVGSPIANRRQAQVEGLIGFFVNTLALRGDLRGDPSFSELLARVRDGALAAYAHQDLPFERLVEELCGERDLMRPSLVQVVFAVQNAAGRRLELPGLDMEVVEAGDQRTSKFDLTVVLSETDGGFVGSAEYCSALFDATTVERWMGHLKTLLESAVTNPRSPLSALPWARPAQRHQLLIEWPDTSSGYERDDDLFALFERQAKASPEAIAAVCGGSHLSYRNLAHRARRLAVDLRRRGVALDSGVGVALGPSLERLVALVGTVAAGGAYVPLDPSYPEERRAFMIEDVGMPLVLNESDLAPLPQNDGRLPPNGTATSLAYVVYTSGSTGRPKGVAVPRRAVARLVRETNFAPFDARSTVLQLAPVAFDASTLELWGPLLNGGRLVIYPQQVPSLAELGETLVRERVNLLWLTSGLFHQMVDEHLEALSGVRHLLAGGDVLSPPHVRRVLTSLPNTRLINGYGPTENTTFTTCYPMTGAAPPPAAVPIGREIANTRVALLDRRMMPVPVGALGELMAAGDGLARGYFARPGLSAERLIPDPLASRPGERLYRTGDLARHRGDGVIEFFGRFDHQVKLRGFRIELGEIEAAFSHWPGVREAVVLVREDRPGDRRLVAYLVGDVPPAAELRETLMMELPEYMVPAAFVTLEALPLNANGKLDRKALPAPEWGGTDEVRLPRTPTEELLAGIWAEILGIERVGVDESFFELGGHSLLATRVISSIAQALGVELPLRTMFETATLADLATRVDEALRSERGRSAPPLTPVARDGRLPLSFAQERLWFLDRLDPGQATYNVPMPLRLTGDLDMPALAASLDEIVRRHEALRTTFAEIDGQPAQIVGEHSGVNIPVVDLSPLTPTAREEMTRRLIAADSVATFDLTAGPLMRCLLLRLDARDHLVLFTLHHIVCDGWSVGVLVNEFSELYRHALERWTSPLRELPVQYADFAAWQRRWLTGEALEQELDWWRQELGSAPRVLELPTDRPRPPVQSFAGAVRPLRLSAELTEAVSRLSREQGATLFMTLLASLQVLLSKWSGAEQLLIGSPIANRRQAEIEGLIGFFVNTLVLRGDPRGDLTFGELLRQARERCLGAFAHQDLPFEKLVDELQPDRDLSRSPLFQAVLSLQNAPTGALELPGLTLGFPPHEGRTAKFDLMFSLMTSDRGLLGEVEYCSDLFDATTVDRLVKHYRVMLSAILEDPHRSVSDLPWLSAAERHQLVWSWNETAWDELETRGLGELFAARARERPEAVALYEGRASLTWRALEERSSRLAEGLLAAGLAPEEPVALSAPRGLELVVMMLGVVRAGGWYVPISAEDPPERLRFVTSDAGARRVLVDARSRQSVAAALVDCDVQVQEVRELIRATPAGQRLLDQARGSRLAYAIYTSGSTGTPKGVAIAHRGVVRLVRGTDYLDLGPEDRMAQISTPTFDAVTFELWGALLNGSTVEVLSKQLALSPVELGTALRERRVTVMYLTAALIGLIGREAPDALGTLDTQLFGGETVDPTAVERILAGSPPKRLLHVYGPTETTVWNTWERLQSVPPGAEVLPSGRPIARDELYIVDRQGQPAPAGVLGDILLGGPGLARGYLERPGLTATTFLPDNFSGRPGDRVYRTGDLGRQLADGRLMFGGRRDGQIKLRGLRIELGEVESALRDHAGVRGLVVELRSDAPGGRALVAWVLASPDAGARLETELRERAQRRLPEYMVPAAFVRIDEFPLTPNGKVDRKALARRAIPVFKVETAEDASASRTPVEELLAGIWAEVLGIERIGVEENFFELGGHSLLATQVISRVSGALGVDVPLRALFEDPTVSAFAQRVDEALTTTRDGALPALERVPREGHLPLSFAQERLWFLDRLEPGQTNYNVPLHLRLTGDLDVAALNASLDEIVRRHETLRTSFAEVDGKPSQVVAPHSTLSIPLVDFSALAEAEREVMIHRLVIADSATPFDLATGPLMRCRLLRLGDRDHLVLFTLHHIVFDGWSVGVLVHEFSVLYRHARERRPSPLPELEIQYADFAAWQRGWLSGEVLERELDWWLDQIGSAPRVLEVPTDRPRPAVQSYAGAVRPVRLSAELTEAAKRLSRERGTTLFMTLVAGFEVLLSKWSGAEQLLVGSPIANRRQAQVEALIGFFVNTLVLRGDLRGDPTFHDLLDQARERSLSAYAHQDLPFEKLVDELQAERDLSRSPVFQVVFSLQNAPAGSLELPGLTLSLPPPAARTAKFDLVVSLAAADRGMTGAIEYSSDLFDATTVDRLAKQFQVVLADVLANAQRPFSDVSWLTRAERHQMVVETREPIRLKSSSAVETELALLELWRGLLDIEQIEVDEDFFELGGDFQLANQLVQKIRDRFRRQLSLNIVFEAPTVARLAAVIEDTPAEAEDFETLDQLLSRVETLSANDLQELLVQGSEDEE